eukprot:3371311-Rhodomonas_salina.4
MREDSTRVFGVDGVKMCESMQACVCVCVGARERNLDRVPDEEDRRGAHRLHRLPEVEQVPALALG